MKYLEKSFSTPANSAAYRDNWAATFGGTCERCDDTELKHQEDHPGLCCDCFDRLMGKP